MKLPIRIGRGILALALAASQVLWIAFAASLPDPGEEILAKIEVENVRRHERLHGYSAARQYTLQNHRFGKEAAASVLMNYQHDVGEQYTVLSRSGSERLNEIIDKVIASELNASLPSEKRRHEIGPANYRARLLGTAVVAERNCYLIQLIPRIKAQYLIGGKAWIDSTTYAVVRVEGQFAVSLSPLVGAPRITEDFVEVGGFWLPGHVHSVTSSFLLGATELSIHFSNYRILPES